MDISVVILLHVSAFIHGDENRHRDIEMYSFKQRLFSAIVVCLFVCFLSGNDNYDTLTVFLRL